jgi:hypothetical protein
VPLPHGETAGGEAACSGQLLDEPLSVADEGEQEKRQVQYEEVSFLFYLTLILHAICTGLTRRPPLRGIFSNSCRGRRRTLQMYLRLCLIPLTRGTTCSTGRACMRLLHLHSYITLLARGMSISTLTTKVVSGWILTPTTSCPPTR